MDAPGCDSETQPLLQDTERNYERHAAPTRQIGVVTAVFMIFNRMIGTGVFATPSTILGFSGSVGLALLMWVIGALFALCGMQVYIIWGAYPVQALPHNGGEKNYLEHLFPRPARLISSIYAGNAVLLAFAAGNSLVFAEYTLASFSSEHPSASDSMFSPVRIVAFLCLTGVILLHGLHIPSGLRLQNALGFLKLGILLIVVGAGFIALSGNLQEGVQRPGNFDSWETIWEGSRTGGSVISACLYNVIWSYVGFSNANYALSEMKDPARTLRIAGPVAIITVGIFYFLCNIAYFAAASKVEITGSGRLVAALLFRNVWGARTERVLNGFVALSALGNVLSVLFAQGRVNQELGKKQVLPYSDIWASDWPAKAPLAGLGLHWAICLLVIFTIPEGDAYNFVININSYPLAVINATISIGLLYLSLRNHRFFAPGEKSFQLPPPLRSSDNSTTPHDSHVAPAHGHHTPTVNDTQLPRQTQAQPQTQTQTPTQPQTHTQMTHLAFTPRLSLIIPTAIFAASNVFLVIMPLTKPPPGVEPYERLPYWTHAAGGWAVFALGAVWWVYRERKVRGIGDGGGLII